MSENYFKPDMALADKLLEVIDESETEFDQDLATIFYLLHHIVEAAWKAADGKPDEALPWMEYLINASKDVAEHAVEVTKKRIGVGKDMKDIIRQAAENKYKN
jgi:hypothetical protein